MLGELFDPEADRTEHDRTRPHWAQHGVIVFVTFRTIDSIPKKIIQRWNREKTEWLDERGLLLNRHWSHAVETLRPAQRRAFQREFHRTREDFLDTCRGRCVLSRPELAKVVADALLHFDGDRYQMGDFVVMPNHVHLLASFPDADRMERQFASWLHFTAYRLNGILGEKGHFWQQEPFDHLVRSVEQYEYLRRYIAENPARAGLEAGQFFYRRHRR